MHACMNKIVYVYMRQKLIEFYFFFLFHQLLSTAYVFSSLLHHRQRTCVTDWGGTHTLNWLTLIIFYKLSFIFRLVSLFDYCEKELDWASTAYSILGRCQIALEILLIMIANVVYALVVKLWNAFMQFAFRKLVEFMLKLKPLSPMAEIGRYAK